MNVSEVTNLSEVRAFKNQYAIYQTSDKVEGIIDRSGNIILPATEYLISRVTDNLFNLLNVEKREEYTFDADLNTILPISIFNKINDNCYIFSEIDFSYLNDPEAIVPTGICDKNYEVIIPAIYEFIMYYANTFWLKKTDHHWIVLNEQYEQVYSDVEDFIRLVGATPKDLSVAVAKDGEYYLLSPEKERITKGHYEYLEPFTVDGYALAKLDGKIIVIDEKENILLCTDYSKTYDKSERFPASWKCMWVASNRLAFYKNGKFGLMTPTGEVIVKPEYYFINTNGKQNLIPVRSTEGFRGYVDINGKIVVPCKYKSTTFIKPINQIEVKTADEKYGLLDINGNPVLPAIFKYISIDANGSIFTTLN